VAGNQDIEYRGIRISMKIKGDFGLKITDETL
jgi:hypothetical protein